MFETSADTGLLDIAFAKAQGEFGNAIKNAINPHFKNRYADLAAIWDVVRAPLAKHELSVSQWLLETTESRVRVLTRISHKGQYMQATSSVPVSKADAQGHGSGATYAKRYALSAALGIASGDDDDGNAASSGPAKITEAQVARIFGVAKEKAWGRSQILELAKIGGVTRLEDMPQDRYENFCHVIQTKTPEEVLKGKA